jgi:hypothetical protein
MLYLYIFQRKAVYQPRVLEKCIQANMSHEWPHWQKSTKSKLEPKVVCG